MRGGYLAWKKQPIQRMDFGGSIVYWEMSSVTLTHIKQTTHLFGAGCLLFEIVYFFRGLPTDCYFADFQPIILRPPSLSAVRSG